MPSQLNYLLSTHTGLSYNQLDAAKNCRNKSCCGGCYARLVQLQNAGSLEALCNSRAIRIINQTHPFNIDLVFKHTSLKDWDIMPIICCKNTLCKCKNIWTELKNELEIRDQGARFSNSTPYINEHKMSVHAIHILEQTILDPEDLHREEDLYS